MAKLTLLAFLFSVTQSQTYPVTDSDECHTKCLNKRQTFCLQESWTAPNSRGVCCDAADNSCEGLSGNGVCSSSIDMQAMRIFACPHESDVCGARKREITLPKEAEVTTAVKT